MSDALDEETQKRQRAEAVGTLARGVAHELNNIFSVILSYAELLETSNEYPNIQDDVQEISAAARRGTALMRQLLTFSGRAVVRSQPLDLNRAIRSAEPSLRRMAPADLELVLALADDLPEVSADPAQAEQLLINLSLNAMEAMPNGGTLILETRRVDLDESYTATKPDVKPGAYAALSVTDTGSGVDPAIADRIFEPFFTTKEGGRGMGLGLTLVEAIAARYGGHVAVYSELGHGAAFKVYLPFASPAESAAAASRSGARRGGTALLVEDDPAVRRATRIMLDRIGMRVIETSGGREALAVLADSSAKIDVMVTDIMMPHMSGAELARHVSAQRPELPILFMSGYTEEAVVRRELVQREHTFLQKPFTAEQMSSALDFLLARSSRA